MIIIIKLIYQIKLIQTNKYQDDKLLYGLWFKEIYKETINIIN